MAIQMSVCQSGITVNARPAALLDEYRSSDSDWGTALSPAEMCQLRAMAEHFMWRLGLGAKETYTFHSAHEQQRELAAVDKIQQLASEFEEGGGTFPVSPVPSATHAPFVPAAMSIGDVVLWAGFLALSAASLWSVGECVKSERCTTILADAYRSMTLPP